MGTMPLLNIENNGALTARHVRFYQVDTHPNTDMYQHGGCNAMVAHPTRAVALSVA